MHLALSPRFSALATLALALTLGACDYHDHRDDDVIGNDIIVRTFSVDGNDYDVDDSGTIASYQRDVPEMTEDVVEDGAVLLYAGDEVLFGESFGTWTALPTSVGFDEDGDEFVDFTFSITYSYDIQDLYVDIIASSPLDFEAQFPDVDFRLVLIPGNRFTGNATVDFTSYESVQKAFALPE